MGHLSFTPVYLFAYPSILKLGLTMSEFNLLKYQGRIIKEGIKVIKDEILFDLILMDPGVIYTRPLRLSLGMMKRRSFKESLTFCCIGFI
jgi:hypothetical protein